MTEPGGADLTWPPTTGDAVIDQALARLSDLDAAPLSEQHERLSRAHEVLQQALNRDQSG